MVAASVTAGEPPTVAPAALAALGERLFFDPRLSANGSVHCGSCHQPEQHFTDAKALSLNIHNAPLRRNTPTLFNVAYRPSLGWLDEQVVSLKQQHHLPMQRTDPIEMGSPQLHLLNQDRELLDTAATAFEQPTLAFSMDNITTALAAYTATLTYRSDFDRYLLDDQSDALSPAAKRGLKLFTSEKLACSSCHEGPDLGGGYRRGSVFIAAQFVLRPVRGKRNATNRKIRTPSLRAVTHTAPYMHDGRLADLSAVVDFYAHGEPADLTPFTLLATDKLDLLAFLTTL